MYLMSSAALFNFTFICNVNGVVDWAKCVADPFVVNDSPKNHFGLQQPEIQSVLFKRLKTTDRYDSFEIYRKALDNF